MNIMYGPLELCPVSWFFLHADTMGRVIQEQRVIFTFTWTYFLCYEYKLFQWAITKFYGFKIKLNSTAQIFTMGIISSHKRKLKDP